MRVFDGAKVSEGTKVSVETRGDHRLRARRPSRAAGRWFALRACGLAAASLVLAACAHPPENGAHPPQDGAHSPAMHQTHAAAAAAGRAPPEDGRQTVEFPPMLKEHTLASMRDHLLALAQIQQSLAQDAPDRAAELAEQRLGMSSLPLHGAHEVARFMPKGMQDAGTAMHRAASRFAIAARDAGASGDPRQAMAALADLTATCVACHAGYRLK